MVIADKMDMQLDKNFYCLIYIGSAFSCNNDELKDYIPIDPTTQTAIGGSMHGWLSTFVTLQYLAGPPVYCIP